jgi:hypothetical protein
MGNQPQLALDDLLRWKELDQSRIPIRRRARQDRKTHSGLAGCHLDPSRIGRKNDFRAACMLGEPSAADEMSALLGP